MPVAVLTPISPGNRVRHDYTVPLTGTPADMMQSPQGKLSRPNPFAAVDLLELARIADGLTAQLVTCRAFVRKSHEQR